LPCILQLPEPTYERWTEGGSFWTVSKATNRNQQAALHDDERENILLTSDEELPFSKYLTLM